MAGRYEIKDRMLIKYEKEDGKLYNPPAWTINLDMIPIQEIGARTDKIRYITPLGIYEISTQDALRKGYKHPRTSENKWVMPFANRNWTFNDRPYDYLVVKKSTSSLSNYRDARMK